MMSNKWKFKLAVLSLVSLLAGISLNWYYQQQQSRVESVSPGAYVVKSGDTLELIARQHGISIEQLQKANGLKDRQLRAGQQLKIPLKTAINIPETKSQPAYVAATLIDVRESPNIKASLVTQALHGEPVKVIQRNGEWAEVSLPDQFDYRGWAKLSEIGKVDVAGDWQNRKIVTAAATKVYSLPDKRAATVTVLQIGSLVASGRVVNDFIEVRLANGGKGFVLASDVTAFQQRSPNRVSGADILKTARQLLRQPYLWGGMSTSGVDCSGFVHTVFKVNGIKLHRDAYLQYDYDGIKIPTKDLKPGDLVFFQTYKRGASHMGIYVGDRRFINAIGSRGVSYDSLDNPYFSKRFLGAKRILTKTS